jgi:hypothetical protein
MLQVFHLNAVDVLQWLLDVFASVSDICCMCFICFEHILQVFHLNITKIDLLLHMLQQDPSAADAYCSC